MPTYEEYMNGLTRYHDKHERVLGLFDIHSELDPDIFWRLFRSIWTGSESLFRHGSEIRRMLSAERLNSPARLSMMTDQENAFLKRSARRSTVLKVYRGGCLSNITGMSWTTKRKAAERYAQNSGHEKPRLLVGRVPLFRVIAHFSTDSEIVVFPETVVPEDLCELTSTMKEEALAMRRFQITVQAVGAARAMDMDEVTYFRKQVDEGRMPVDLVVNHMRDALEVLEPLGFKTKAAKVREILEAFDVRSA